jgi:hypothetical protein
MNRPVDTREIPDGFHMEAVPEAIGHWRPVTGKSCRYARQGHVQCGEPSAAELLRGYKRHQWWAYCESHMYGRWVENGRVWHWILVSDADPFALELTTGGE